MLAVEFRWLGKEIHFIFREILICCFVGNHIDGVCENGTDGKAGELLAALRDAAVLQQILVSLAERAGFREYFKNRLDELDLLWDGFELAGFLFLAVHRYAGQALGGVACGRCAAQPAPSLGQLVHVVSDALGDGLPLQLGEYRCNVHHGTAHRGGGVELLPDGDEVNVPFTQILDKLGKVADVAADAVETIDHDGCELGFLRVLHHFFKLWTLQIATGKAFIFIDQRSFRRILTKVHGDVLAAQLNLVLDTFTFAGEFGLAGVDDVLFWNIFYFHGGTSLRLIS